MDYEVTAKLSEYEKIRLANIREREALFLKLNFSKAKKDLLPQNQKKKPSQKRKKRVHIAPTRSSLRLSLQQHRYVLYTRKDVEFMVWSILLYHTVHCFDSVMRILWKLLL